MEHIMSMSSSEKISMIEKRISGPLAELGFSISRKNSLDVCFSRTVDGVRQDIQVVLHRYADQVCARYGTSMRIDLTMQKRRVREFMARECPWHRPEDMEWISFNRDEGLPEALDRLVFIIKGVGIDILDEMMKSAPVKTLNQMRINRQRSRKTASIRLLSPNGGVLLERSHVSGSAGMNGLRSCLQQPDRSSWPTVSSSMNGTAFRTGGSAVRLRSVLITFQPAPQSRQ
jgi:hypothetical protein